MRFSITTLGTGAALPARGRYPSAQLLNVNEHLYLVDCGEGTQERLRQAEVNFNRIERILIGHMHGDHYLGLMGLISSMHLQGRLTELHVHGPVELREVIGIQLRASQTWLRYPLHFHPVEHVSGTELFHDARLIVTSLALKHRIPTTGFLFRERPPLRKLKLDALPMIPHYARNAIKGGADLVLPDGTIVPNGAVTLDPPAQRSYAYCSDTAFEPALIPFLQGVDLLYHEATFTEQLAARAKETLHSTARQAGIMARDAQVGRLMLGHFSSRYKDVRILLDEAMAVFPHTCLAQEGSTFHIDQVQVGDRSVVEGNHP